MDFTSLEVLITEYTVRIRNHQKEISELKSRGLDNRKRRHVLKILVDQRRVLLRRLRNYDIKKFEWLLEKLNLYYKPRPFSWERITREKHLTRLTDLWCEEFKEYQLEEFKRNLQHKQPQYLRDKAESLRYEYN